MDKPRYTIPFDFDDPTKELVFNQTSGAIYFPKRIYGETAFEILLQASKSGVAYDFSNFTLSEAYIKIADTTVIEVVIATGTISGLNPGEMLWSISKDMIPNSYALQTSTTNAYPIKLYIVVESSDGSKISLETQIQVMDIDREGTQDNSVLDATGISYNPSDTAKWSVYFGTPTTIEDALNKLAFADRRDQGAVISRIDTPPGSPLQGDRHLVIATATGAWVGQEDNIAEWNGTAWVYLAPRDGEGIWSTADQNTYRYETSAWVSSSLITDHGALGGLLDDDHTQYSLADGTRAYTGEVQGVASATGSGLVTKDQMDSAIASATAGFTDLGVVDDRAITPPAHSVGLKILIDTTLGSPTGDFVGNDNQIATSDGAAWSFSGALSEGDSVWVDDENVRYSYDADGSAWAKASAGETNTASSLGAGVSQFNGKVGSDLQFNSNTGVDGIATTLNTNVVEYGLDYSSLANQASPAGTMKIAIDNAGTIEYVDWTQLPTGDTMSNVGTGSGVFKQQVGNNFELRSIKAADTNSSVVINGDDIEVGVPNSSETARGAVELATSAEVDTGTDTARATTPAGVASVYKRKKLISNNQTGTSYTLLVADFSDEKTVWMNNAAANVVTLDTDANQNADTDMNVEIIQEGAGVTTITAAAGVTLNGTVAGSIVLNNQYQGVVLVNRGTDIWIAIGDYT